MTQTDKEKLRMAKNLVKANNKKIKKALELIQAFEHEDAFLKESSSHILYRSHMNMNDLIKEIKKTLEK